MKRVAINGFGRIGRSFFKLALEEKDFQIVAINDLSSVENAAYLLKYDSTYGPWDKKVEVKGKDLVVSGKKIEWLSEKSIEKLPWKKLNIDIVIESTGVYTSYKSSTKHISTGAKRVIISAPVKDDGGETVLFGVNNEKLNNCKVSSNASCTTNAVAVPLKILDETLGVEKAILNTVHSYTSSQNVVDNYAKKNNRLGRAAAQNLIPTSTGASIATTKVLNNLENKFDGVAIRVPTIAGSIADITFISKKKTTVKEVNNILEKAAKEKKYKEVFGVTEEEVVSSDIINCKKAALIDLAFTRVVDGNLVKIFSWYDNEMGYVNSLYNHAKELSKLI